MSPQHSTSQLRVSRRAQNEIEDAGPSTSSADAAPDADAAVDDANSIGRSDQLHRPTPSHQSRQRRRRRPPPLPPSLPPPSSSPFATNRLGAYVDPELEKEFWRWLNPQALKADVTTLLVAAVSFALSAIAFLRTKQQNPVVLGPVVAAYLLLALCVRRDPRAWAERRRLRVMPFVRVSPLLTMVCNTAARRGRRITSLSLLPPSVTSAVVSSVSSSLLSPLSSVSPFSSLLASASAAAPPPSLPFPSPFSPSPPVPSQSINWISFFLKIPRVYAVAIPGLGILLPPKQHALATLACAFLIVASVGPAASDREAIFGREAHEAVARALSALTRVVFGSLWPPNSAGSAASASASSAGADSSSSAVVPAVAVVSGRAATEAVMRTMQVMGCHLAWVLHDALLRRERSRFEEEEEKKRQQEEQEKQDEDDDEKNDDDDDKNSPSSSSPSPSKNRRRRQRPKKTTMRQYLDRTAGADWIIGHAAVHACGWVAVWALCELWESSGSASVFCRWWRRQRQR